MAGALLFDIGVIIIFATFFAFIARFLKQPSIPVYMLAGVFLGPIGLGIITSGDIISVLSELGVIFLLFIVGMEIDIKKLKNVGSFVIYGGSLQVILTFVIAYFFSQFIGFTIIESIVLGMILSLSSTMVVVKLLSDMRLLETLESRIMIGILLIQDIFAILGTSLILGFNSTNSFQFVYTFIYGFGLLLLALFFKFHIFPKVFSYANKSTELLFLTALSSCFFFIGLSEMIGFPMAIGAFIGGLSLAAYPYDLEIISKMSSLRDFFAVLFFVSLGMQIVPSGIMGLFWPIVALILFILIVKPLIIFIIAMKFGYSFRTAFITSVSLSQISEFSLILAGIAVVQGLIPSTLFSITAIVAIVTISVSAYMIRYGNFLFDLLSKIGISDYFDNFFKIKTNDIVESKDISGHTVLIGCHLFGSGILEKLKSLGKDIIVLDYNPEIVQHLSKENHETLKNHKMYVLYGDVRNKEVIEKLNFDSAKFVVSTTPYFEDNKFILVAVKSKSKETVVFLTAITIEDSLKLYELGADYVIIPKFLGKEKVNEHIDEIFASKEGLFNQAKNIKSRHLKKLDTAKCYFDS
ncbi:MAG: cation:proton antiporter [DPANN group archaeon]|nr:cation:proton antiporter [DPANN group archaeon]